MAGKTVADLWFRFFSDTKGLEKGTKTATRELGKAEKASAGVKRGWSDMTKAAGALGLAVGGMEILNWVEDAGKMSEAAGIAAQSADKVLGPAAQRLRDDFSELRGVMGFNVLEFDQLIAKQGLLVTGLGATQDGAGELIGDLVTLGGDLATFSGDVGRTEEAIDAVTAAIRGEFDPLEQWGVKLSAAKIEAERAKRIGIDPMFAALDEGEQTLIIIRDLIEQGAAPAIGSLGGAAETTAGQTNELNSKLEDLQIELGTYVAPVLASATEEMLKGAKALTTLADEASTGRDKLRALGDLWDTLFSDLVTIDEIREEWRMWNDAVRNVRDTIREVWENIKKIPSTITNPFSAWRNPMSGWKLPGFASGGTVGGPRGAPQLAVVHGGEEIRTPSQQATGGSSGGGVVINVNAALSDPQAIARQIVDLLGIYNRTQGALPVTVRDGIG